jgi:hypothetical protein
LRKEHPEGIHMAISTLSESEKMEMITKKFVDLVIARSKAEKRVKELENYIKEIEKKHREELQKTVALYEQLLSAISI